MNNPFSNNYPENMSNQQIKELFVDEFVDLTNILNHNHHFIWGARGSGKSMLFRYIEACCFSDSIAELREQNLIDCPIIPIYYKISSNSLRIVEFSLIDKNYATLLSEHMMVMSIARLTLNTIMKYKEITQEEKVIYVKKVVYELFSINVEKSITRVNKIKKMENEPLEWLDSICRCEFQAVVEYLKNSYKKVETDYQGTIVGYHDFLLPFFELTKKMIKIENLVFYLLIDEAGRTYEFQQEILNGWIACRNHDVLSIKVTAVKAEYLTFYTRDRWSIQNTHDFSETELNIVHYSKSDYKRKIKKIIKKRFDAYGIQIDNIEKFYPTDKRQEEIIDYERNLLKQEYDNGLKKGTFGVYCSRMLMPRVYQNLSDKHLSPSYSGFDLILAASSGIIRNFLEPSRMMYDAAMQQNDKVNEISVRIQTEVINEYSKKFFEKIRYISSDSQERILLTYLENLIMALGKYFRERLLTKGLVEGRIFSFTIKQFDRLEYEERRVLQLAEQYDYLQKSYYSGKNGTSTEDWYLLSRRLAPFFKLDPTAIKGRLALSVDDVKLAMHNPEEFLEKKKNRLQKKVEKEEIHQMSLFDCEEEDILYVEEEEDE